MEHPSSLKQYLDSCRQEGQQQAGEGTFSLAREKALEKLAAFQLPFAGAWALKIVQAVVASGSSQSLKVYQGKHDASFYFEVPSSWALEQVEDAFFDPHAPVDTSLRHLACGLWAVALNQRRAFELRLPADRTRLIWDGQRLDRLRLDESPRVQPSLTISHKNEEVGGSLSNIKVARQIADANKALADNAYTCPIPLGLEGRRIDAFQHCPTHGLRPRSHPYALRRCTAELPGFPVPQKTFWYFSGDEVQVEKPSRLKALSLPLCDRSEPYGTAEVVYLVTYHCDYQREELSHPSVCHWVKDGVVVDQQRLAVPEGPHSVAMFLSAQGLAADLTTLHLRDSEERTRRLEQAAKSVGTGLTEIQGGFFAPWVKAGAAQGRLLGGLAVVGSLGFLPVSLGGAAAGVASSLLGLRHHQARTQQFQERLELGATQLLGNWRSVFG